MCWTGNQATVTFPGFSGAVVDIAQSAATVEVLDESVLATTGSAVKCPADLIDEGQLTVGHFFDSKTTTLPAVKDTGTLVLTYPSQGGTAANKSGSAICVSSKDPDLANNELQRGEQIYEWDGKTGPTYTAEA